MKRFLRVFARAAVGGVFVGGGAVRAEPVPGDQEAKVEKTIQANLQSDPELKDNKVDVRVDGSTAMLTGIVDSNMERARAARIAAIGPITVVDNRLKVESVGIENTINDSGITTAIKAEFLQDSKLRHADVGVDTNNGVVTLKGTVATADLRRHAITVAHHTAGVKRVDDEIRIASR
jgi:hyperosmotically inducible protein